MTDATPKEGARNTTKDGLRPSHGSLLKGRDSRQKRRRLVDRFAKLVVTGGGLLVILVILAMLVFVGYEAYPLLTAARVGQTAALAVGGGEVLLVATDDRCTLRLTAGLDGVVRLSRDGKEGPDERYDFATGRRLAPGEEPETRFVAVQATPGERTWSGLTADGRIAVFAFRWLEAATMAAEPVRLDATSEVVSFEAATAGSIGPWCARFHPDRGLFVCAQRDGRAIELVQLRRERNEFTDEIEVARLSGRIPHTKPLGHLLFDSDWRWIYGLERDDQVLHSWVMRGLAVASATHSPATGAPITAFSMLIGDQSLLIGRRDGTVEVWARVRTQEETAEGAREVERPRFLRSFELSGEAVAHLAPSKTSRVFGVLGVEGTIALFHSTANRQLWVGQSDFKSQSQSLSMAPLEDGFFVGGAGIVEQWSLSAPHAGASWTTYFSKIHYERQAEPAYTWQSSAANDAYEPKLSLIPLIFGTLKGTLFALILAVPIAVLAALYTSQFLHHSVRDLVKPVIEIMAALPSVVLGFVAALWIAPRIETVLPGLFFCAITVPLSAFLAHWLFGLIPKPKATRLPKSAELGLALVAVAIGAALGILCSGLLERMFFGGDFPTWIREELSLIYDQRNALVIAIAMGFAVIPIIYTISEDAFSNVPKTLALGSRGLGATPWQTVSKIILPSASPGVFSAIMIGFGRAVGETMIVLMATGNTPITDWNPFNGFRTLSANIAVELPEAPHHGTLYRTLFLSAFLLFLITFTVNTLAEIVRERLRKKYGRL